MFKNRLEAGRMLLTKLHNYASQAPILLAVNRGGVAVAQPITRYLRAPLDVILTRPIYANGGLSIGALATGGGRSMDEQLLRSAGMSPARLAEQIERARHGLQAPSQALRGDRPFPDVTHRVVITVCDGLGTAHDVIAALRSVRARQPRWLAHATPFVPPEVARHLLAETDVVVSLLVGDPTGSIYEDLHHPDDAETHALLNQHTTAQEEERLAARARNLLDRHT